MFSGSRSPSIGIVVSVALWIAFLVVPGTAGETTWRIAKWSGQAAVTRTAAAPVSFEVGAALAAGDIVSTGQNGRVLLIRGEESILIAPNSVVALPPDEPDRHSTTVLQRAGSITLSVEKRLQGQFSVETPYLAAVVKGTQFVVAVDAAGAHVDVVRGKVEVTDFRSGESALVLPNQSAAVTTAGPAGLTVTGSGSLGPVRPGEAKTPASEAFWTRVERLPGADDASPSAKLDGFRTLFADGLVSTALPQPVRQESRWDGLIAWLDSLVPESPGRDRQEKATFTVVAVAAIGLAASIGTTVLRRRRRKP